LGILLGEGTKIRETTMIKEYGLIYKKSFPILRKNYNIPYTLRRIQKGYECSKNFSIYRNFKLVLSLFFPLTISLVFLLVLLYLTFSLKIDK